MKIKTTPFHNLVLLEPIIYHDERGHFMESYNAQRLTELGIVYKFVQDNRSFSRRGVIRGLHFQIEPKAQTKLVTVLEGSILDVVVDLRKDQPTYRQVHVVELSSKNHLQLLVPKGFAHGFSVLSDTAEVLYKCDEFYSKECEGGIRYNDPVLQIDWRVPMDQQIVSGKDLALHLIDQAKASFVTVP